VPADEQAGPAQVALILRKRKPGSPGEAELNQAQVAPRKRRKNPERAVEAEPSPVQVAPKKKRNNPERAVEAEPSSSAVCTADAFGRLRLKLIAFQVTRKQTPPSGGSQQEPQ